MIRIGGERQHDGRPPRSTATARGWRVGPPGYVDIPDEGARQKGIKYKVGLLPGKNTDTEMVKILALKKAQDNLDMTFGNYQMALKKLQYFLVDLPRDEVVESNIIYSIVE